MNPSVDGFDEEQAASVVDLAREAPLALGGIAVTPAALSVSAGGWTQRLERRAMQVLVVLAQAAPTVVGRTELNRRVWGGRVVGDDAINRAVQTLRRLAADAPPPAPFAIETIPRVGYRLTVPAEAQAIEALAQPGEAPPRRDRRAATWLRGVGVLALLLLVALVVWRARQAPEAAAAPWRLAGAQTLDDLPPGARDVALSPDSRRLAYRGQDDGGRERIFVRASAGGGVGLAVSPPDLDARRLAWSPDGARLAFVAYDAGRPCRLYVVTLGRLASPIGECETAREPRLAWSADGRALIFGDAPGENAVPRIVAFGVADGRRLVLSSPPGDSLGDDAPLARGPDIVFRRLFGWADEGWVKRDLASGRERLLWRRRGVANSVAAALPDATLAVAWTQAGSSGLDLIDGGGRTTAAPVVLGPVTALAVANSRLLVETDRSESTLMIARDGATTANALATVRGRAFAPILLADGRLRFPVAAVGVARLWERDPAGALKPWGSFTAASIVGLALSPDGTTTAALVTSSAGREIALFDSEGRVIRRWHPHARSLNPAAWNSDGRRLVVPVLDGTGWRLFTLDPFSHKVPHDLALPGFAVVQNRGAALYGVRAGEATGGRELWRLDGAPRRLPIDLTLFDIVNWRAVAAGVWVPDRTDRTRPRLVLRDTATGREIRSVAAPGLTGAGSGLAAGASGPFYVSAARGNPEYSLLTLSR